MAINQNFSTDQPSLAIDFARSGRLDPRITFSRSTARSYFNEDGLLVSSPANIPRFNYAFPRVKNLLNQTDRLSNWSEIEVGGSVTTTDHNAGAPDGTSTATLVTVVAGGTGGESIYLDVPIKGNGTYTSSVFVKAGTVTSINVVAFYLWNTTQAAGQLGFNPVTGQIIAGSGTVVPYPNGWYRIHFTHTGNNVENNTLRFQIYFSTSGTVSLWGPQLEEGSTVTDYVASSSGETYVGNIRPKPEGLILEPSTTNYSKYSQIFTDTWASGSGGSGTKYLNDSTITSNVAWAPDGTTTASRFQASISAGRVTNIITTVPGTTKAQHMCYSVFVKPNGTSSVRLDLVSNFNTTDYSYRANTTFYLVGKGSYDPVTIATSSDGQASPFAFATIEPLLNGWYRCSISFRTYNGASTLNACLGEIRAGKSTSDILIWGDQFEPNSFPTSYLATNGAAVSGGSDFAHILGTSFTNNYNIYEGTFFAEFTPKGTLGPEVYGGIFGVSSTVDPTPFNFLFINPYNSYAQYVATRSQTITALIGTSDANAVNKLCKVAGSYSTDSYDFTLNGQNAVTVSINNGALVYDFNSFIFGRNTFTNSNSLGNIVLSKVMYYPKKLNSLNLRSLTQ